MLITYYGHALFALETAQGITLITDPYDETVGYPMGRLRGDVVTVSHEHHDHNNVSLVEGSPAVVRGEGVFTPLPGIRVTGFPSFHDGRQGELRGKNTLFLLEAEGLRALHLGDLGHPLPADMLERLAPVDILMVPVGGYYTIDASQAADLCRGLAPGIILPMHYQTAHSQGLPIARAQDFLREMEVSPLPMPLLRVTKEDLVCQPKVALLSPRPLPG